MTIRKNCSLRLIAAAALLTLISHSCTRVNKSPYANDTTLEPRQAEAAGKLPRVIVMTDAETDDRCSMVHFLLYSNDMQVDAIIQSNSCFQRRGWSSEPWLEEQISAYEKVYPNLKVHDSSYPTPEYLRSVVFLGDEDPDHVGDVNARLLIPGADPVVEPSTWADTPGSDRIVEVLLEDDPRPVYLQAWGGSNTAARALYKLKTQYPDQYERAAKKAILYCIWYQDGGGSYIERNFPEVTILLNHHFSGSWDYGTMMNSDNFVSQYLQNGKNPLGALYTQPYISEGDSPSFLYSIDNGLRSYEDPTFGGWGGRFYKVDGYENVYRDTGFGELREWLETAMHDFQARLTWCITPEREKGNHAPVITFPEGQDRTVHPGDTVTLKIGVEDNDLPDLEGIWKMRSGLFEQQGMTYAMFKERVAADPSVVARFSGVTVSWYQYQSGTYPGSVDLIYRGGNSVSFVAPEVDVPHTLHFIAEATDRGTPPLTSYARFIITVLPR